MTLRYLLAILAGLVATAGPGRADELPDAVTGDFLRTTLRAQACEVPYEDAKDSAMVYEFGPDMRLIDFPCRYESEREPNHRSLMYLVDLKGGEPQRVTLSPPGGQPKAKGDFVTNAEVDERRKLVLSPTWRKDSRDCGTIGRWHFNGQAFELRDYFVKPTCDGEAFDVSNKAVEKWRVFSSGKPQPKKR